MAESTTLDGVIDLDTVHSYSGVLGERPKGFRCIDGSMILSEIRELKEMMGYLASKGISLGYSSGKSQASSDLTIEKLFEAFRIELSGRLRKPVSSYNPLSIILISMNEGLPIIGCRGYSVMDKQHRCRKIKVNGSWVNPFDTLAERIEEYINKNHCYKSICPDCYYINYPAESITHRYKMSMETV